MLDFLKKKKENSFSLDDTTLPSMSSMKDDSNSASQPLDSISSNNSYSENNNNSFSDSLDTSAHPASSDHIDNYQLAQENPLKDQSSFPQPSYASSEPANPFATNQPIDTQQQPQQIDNLSKIQLETIDKKISLLDSRVHVIEDKINKIYEMISMEVKPETKMRVEINKQQ